VKLNGKPVNRVDPGTYLVIERKWKRGDMVDLEFDFSLQFWAGERECANKVSVYRGPILMTYDRRFNEIDPDKMPTLDAAKLSGKIIECSQRLPPFLLMEFLAEGGRTVRLCDFGSAGTGGSPYRSWLAVKGVSPVEFSSRHPLRLVSLGR